MEDLIIADEDFSMCRIDIDNWHSEVAEQYGISSLPYLMLYNGDELVSVGTEQVLRDIASR